MVKTELFSLLQWAVFCSALVVKEGGPMEVLKNYKNEKKYLEIDKSSSPNVITAL